MDKRERMRALCAKAGSMHAAVEVVVRVSRRPISIDAFKSWTCSQETSRARPVPDWVIDILEEAFAMRKAPKKTEAAPVKAALASPPSKKTIVKKLPKQK